MRSFAAAADAETVERTREGVEWFDDDVHVRTPQTSPDISATVRHVDQLPPGSRAADTNVHRYYIAQSRTDTKNQHVTPSEEHVSDGGDVHLKKRRKPPEYVGYAGNVESDVDVDEQLAKSKESAVNDSETANGAKTDVVKQPVPAEEFFDYGRKTEDDRVWRETCGELNCVGGSVCIPDTLRDRRPRCQCPLGTDGLRCQRRMSPVEIYL